ncbi:helix-turn-helix transcriptional regulator [Cohnella sp. WQ 127256]|uniref:helix-turn-helix transcriptional regulator n=1 Tax=Cohnella sp. WQ 127256 TaxID=2938790 RepID=UPI0021186D65|nr:helix-turn-helix transcriptional regulator [Cohnella sp. WQ 127256]
MINESYTTEEIAKLLKISKLTVYDLLKKGELASYRVGKQMRVDASDLKAFKLRAKGVVGADILQDAASSSIQNDLTRKTSSPAPIGDRQLVITGQDVSLDILSRHIEKQAAGTRSLRSFTSSMDSLVSMYRGESDIVSVHLLDGDTCEYNIPYIRKLFVSQSYIVVHLLARSAGLYVQKGNPKNIMGWDDLLQPGITIVNREKGSGARTLLDEQLRIRKHRSSELLGYEHEESNHLAVAGRVAANEVDVGVGIEKAAQLVGNMDYIPLIQEQYDLVMLKLPDNLHWIQSVIQTVQSDAYKNELKMIHGYDLSRTGQILYET